MNLDISKLRQDTPGCEHVLHFNNAGAALMTRQVVEAMNEHHQLELLRGGYEAQAIADSRINRVYHAISQLIHCLPHEIAILENSTAAWDMAFYSIPFQQGDRILTSMSEYCSNYIAFLQVAKRTGAGIEVIPNDEYGQTSVEALRQMMDERVKLIAINHVPTNSGLINPAAAIGRIAQQSNAYYLLDACQSVGQIPIDVNEIQCDFLTATGRKYLRGPRGTGFLYVREALIEQLEPPFLDCHSAEWVAKDRYVIRPDASRFENWESNQAIKIGFGVAVDYLLDLGIERVSTRIVTLAEQLRSKLEEISGVRVTDIGEEKCGIVTFTSEQLDTVRIKQELASQNMNVHSIGPGSARLDMEDRQLERLIRASVHYYNTDEEIDRFCTVLSSILNRRG
ncbi:aminotransferase class V-fold PLP-dependent enzyme [Brevibacillus ginsengisoli]|uniref:aminotransferase class V-fold PLP-dependent enzyme n=1 Tax=Brevibacillus ginsengisoli TaxID=363854 RepID=UPI003CF8C8BB